MSAPLWCQTATDLRAGFHKGAFTPIDVLAAVLARIDAVNPKLNAVISPCYDDAARAAEASARRYQSGQPLSPLDGIPLTVKDNILIKNCRATWGSLIFEDFIPIEDETPVAKLRAAGAVLLGKTNVSELTLEGYTDNALFGATRNPWDLALTPGGSSGGGAAAIAAGMGALALCTDGGGSIRRPAAHVGMVGFKPSQGAVPRAHGFPKILLDFEVAGPIARSVGDCVMMMDKIADFDSSKDGMRPGRTYKIVYVPHFGDHPVAPDITASVAAKIDDLAAAGHSIEVRDSFDLAADMDHVWPVIAEVGAASIVAQDPDLLAKLSPTVAAMAKRGANHAATAYLTALLKLDRLRAAFENLFKTADFMITPATAAQPWPVHDSHPAIIDGKPVGPRGHAVFTAFANALGLPGLSLPCAPDAAGLPIGMQILAPKGQDEELLNFGLELEQAQLIEVKLPQI